MVPVCPTLRDEPLGPPGEDVALPALHLDAPLLGEGGPVVDLEGWGTQRHAAQRTGHSDIHGGGTAATTTEQRREREKDIHTDRYRKIDFSL